MLSLNLSMLCHEDETKYEKFEYYKRQSYGKILLHRIVLCLKQNWQSIKHWAGIVSKIFQFFGRKPSRQVQNMENECPSFIDDGDQAYIVLLNVFKYLTVCDLLSAAKVSKVWNLVASDDTFWRTVSVKESFVTDRDMFGHMLMKHGTQSLNLRDSNTPLWLFYDPCKRSLAEFSLALKGVKTLTNLTIGPCNSTAIKMISRVAPQLESFIAYHIVDMDLDLSYLANFTKLVELKLGGSYKVPYSLFYNEMKLYNCETLQELKNLTTLSLKGFRNLDKVVDYLPSSLVSLELGECELPFEFPSKILPSMLNLKSLKIEKGRYYVPVKEILDAIILLPKLTELEMVGFEICSVFVKALVRCQNLKSLRIDPIYWRIYIDGLTNLLVLKLALAMRNSLEYFKWGLYKNKRRNGVPMLTFDRKMTYISDEVVHGMLQELMPLTKIQIIIVPEDL